MATVVVVDDEPLEREAIKFILRRERPHLRVVGEAGCGRIGLALIKDLQPDILFLDIKMPGIGGIEVLHQVRELSVHSEVVVLTAYDEFDFAHEALKLGARDYLLKPARPGGILKVVDNICREREEAAARLQREQQIEQQLSAAMPLIAKGLVLDLCFGRIGDITAIKERSSFLKIGEGPCTVLYVNIDGSGIIDQKQPEREKLQVVRILQEAVEDDGRALLVPFGSDSFLVIKGEQGEHGGRGAGKLAEKMRQAVEDLGQVTITVGVGELCANLSLLQNSYKGAEAACRYGTLLGGNQVVHAGDIGNTSLGNLVPYSFTKEEELMKLVELAEQGRAFDILEQIWHQLLTASAGEERNLRFRSWELVIGMARAALKGGAEPGDVAKMQGALLEELATVSGVQGVYHLLQSALKQALQLVGNRQVTTQRAAIKQAKRYMSQHFGKQITLEEISRRVHLSPYYFSRLFKEREGLTFIEYLTSLRIEEAKRLLLKTEDKIEVIAQTVGYGEANYFSRLFKRKVGMSPGEYRKRCR
ncbi:MAG: helix-turn-helix domain-containing protein [bacterium]|jgi:two-component system response regulator YesN